MENYFIFNGIDSREYGLFVGDFMDIPVPKKRMTKIIIPGRDGFLNETDDCYDSYNYDLECYMQDNHHKEQIAVWLQGSGELILSNDLDKKFFVTIKNGLNFARIAEYWRNIIIQLDTQPINESVQEFEQLITDIKEFNAGGTVYTHPLLLITGIGNFDITINNNTIHLKDINGTIKIDTKLKVATENEIINASSSISGCLLGNLKLNPKNNKVEISGTGILEEFKIKYRRANLC